MLPPLLTFEVVTMDGMTRHLFKDSSYEFIGNRIEIRNEAGDIVRIYLAHFVAMIESK